MKISPGMPTIPFMMTEQKSNIAWADGQQNRSDGVLKEQQVEKGPREIRLEFSIGRWRPVQIEKAAQLACNISI